jgi:hypothetical protein
MREVKNEDAARFWVAIKAHKYSQHNEGGRMNQIPIFEDLAETGGVTSERYLMVAVRYFWESR